jgi:transposase
MMAAMIGGQRNPTVLAQLARSRMRTKIAALEEAFVGNFTDHHAFLLTRMLARIDAINADITALDTRIEAQIALSLTRWNAWTTSQVSESPPPA